MLTIRDEQFATFEAQEMRKFVDRVIAFLREQFGDMREISEDILRRAIEPLIGKAKEYRLTTEREVVTYIVVAKKLGKDFDEAMPQTAAILSDQRADSGAKVQHLQALLDR